MEFSRQSSQLAIACPLRAQFTLGLIALAFIGCRARRIGGTYVAHGVNFAEMLQLTQSNGGQITGVLSTIELSSDGKLSSDNASVTGGALDGEQLTLTLHPDLFGTNISGTAKGDVIQFETVDSKGEVLLSRLERSSPEEFKKYADNLKASSTGIILNSAISNRTQELRQTAQNAEAWIANAELHSQRIPSAKDYYEKIEDKMRGLVAQEQATANSVARSQISVMVNQGDVAGTQADIQVDQLWDQSIEQPGTTISREFATGPTTCTADEFRKLGADSKAIGSWESVCHQVQSERTKFDPIYKHIMEQRADLKSFQALARSRRKALVNEAYRIQ